MSESNVIEGNAMEAGVVEVGPVLTKSDLADAIIAAIRVENQAVRVIDRGSYWRVLVQGRCRVTQHAVQSVLGRPFVLPNDLELVMPSFTGRLMLTTDSATWEGGSQ
jgi:hypothetical protein